MGARVRQSDQRFAVTLVGIAIGYFVLAAAAVQFAPPGTHVAAWWPAAGLAVSATLWFRGGRRAGVLATIGAASVLANTVSGRPLDVALAFSAANVAEALVATLVLERLLGPRPVLRDPQALVRFLVAVGAGALTAAVMAGLTVVTLQDGLFLTTVWAVTASHGAAVLLLAPLVLVPRGPRGPAGPAEVVLLAVALTAAVLLVFGPGQELPLAFFPLPLLTWAAMRLDAWWALVAVIWAGVLTSLLTSAGHGPFVAAVEAGDYPPEMIGALLQLNLVCNGLVAIPLALAATQRRAALSSAVASNELLESVLAAATGVSIIGMHQDGTIALFNAGAAAMLGYDSEDLVGRASPIVLHDDEEIRTRAAQLSVEPGFGVLTHAVDRGAPSECRDWTYVRKDGSRLTVSLRVTRRVSASGELVGYLGVAEDVTAGRHAEAVLRAALEQERESREALRELDRAKSDFLASVSHELRTPLTSVLGYTDLLLSGAAGELAERQETLVHKVDDNGRRLLELIEDLLLVSRIESSADGQEREVVDLSEMVDRAVTSARVGLGTRELRTDLAAGPCAICGNPSQLVTMVDGLLSNAIKFTAPDGVIQVSVRRVGEEVVLRVEDNGFGIPAAEQSRVFERFYRSSVSQARAVRGTGLGLAIVRGIVDFHGGRLELESAEAEGTTLTVVFPAVSARGQGQRSTSGVSAGSQGAAVSAD